MRKKEREREKRLWYPVLRLREKRRESAARSERQRELGYDNDTK